MVYTSESLALAVIETLVHLRKMQAPEDFVALTVDVPVDEGAFEAQKLVMQSELPPDWRTEGHPALRNIGDRWIKSSESLVLPVPSVVVDGAWNVLVNPLHMDVNRLKVLQQKSFRFDERLFHVPPLQA